MTQEMSINYREYFSELELSLQRIVEIARKARKKGIDPRPTPEIEIASDLAGLVEGFIGLPKISERIRELSQKLSREQMAFKIAEEIIFGRFGRLEEEVAATQAVRAALAILTEGVTAAVYSEGIAKVSIKSNPDGSKYLAIYFAGPIRSAGGTETALTPVIADFVRRLLGLDRYKPTEEEIGRFIEELRLYEREVVRFQYRVSDEEIRKTLENLPVEITGIASEKIEVVSYRNLPRIETNCLRGGALRVLNDGIIGRASKVLAVVEDLKLQGWEWLKEIREAGKKKTSGFMEDVPAGRPILCFPSKWGGFRLRYGRSRNTGLAAVGIHPLTMKTLRNFLAGGTQLRLETPGKSGIVMPVDKIMPPVVRLNDGTVLQVSEENFEYIKDRIEKILFLGDLLVSFGDFLYNNKNLLPSGYTEEWWCEELRQAIMELFSGNEERAAAETGIPLQKLKAFLDDPLQNKPSFDEAVKLCECFKVPLHPSYLFFWSLITIEELVLIRTWLISAQIEISEGKIKAMKGTFQPSIKEILEKICVPHKIISDQIFLEGDTAHAFAFTLGFHNPNGVIREDLSVIKNLSHLSGVTIRDKAPTFIGARVGRPEKAKRRKMKSLVQVLFPVGLEGGPKRDLMKAYERGFINAEMILRVCPKCGNQTFNTMCYRCEIETVVRYVCPKCERYVENNKCSVCKVEARSYIKQTVPLRDLINLACQKVSFTPKQIKGVKGLTNKDRIPEPIEKGILRAKYDLSIYKDGTIRFDATNAPLTHFKPSEIGVTVNKLRALGYSHDYLGKPLEDPDQLCELKVQDVIIPWQSVEYMIRVANFVDDLLEKVYGLPRFYNVSKPEDLIGHLIIGLAPHTCAGILGRIIGFTRMHVCFAHPYWHSAKRRDCDGDEDSIMLAMDAFLNFSREYLPNQIGGMMDSPLFIISTINPQEVQRQAHEIDVSFKYPLVFYENTLKRTGSREIMDLIDLVKHRFKFEAQFESFGFTIPTLDINAGNTESIYKKLKRMSDKLDAQLKLAEQIEAVDPRRVAKMVLDTHFFRDILGNLRAFAVQNFRCKKCNMKFRRVPLRGRCPECGGELTLTVYRGGIEKYLNDARELVKRYNLPTYYSQQLSLIENEIASLFEGGEPIKQARLSKFL
ncbi:MAG: DNA polymerase II large subunit [Nitrososphaerota archaeon]|nr:DNA polymerase II large subunit [Nitrososphaerota archaeon]